MLPKTQPVLWPNFRLNINGIPGLIDVIVQEYRTKEVLMSAHANEEAWEKTLKTGNATFFSKSRKGLWVKGEESGNFMKIHGLRIDCDGDSVIYSVEEVQGDGVACHTGATSCFYRKVLHGGQYVDDKVPPKEGEKEKLSSKMFEPHWSIQF